MSRSTAAFRLFRERARGGHVSLRAWTSVFPTGGSTSPGRPSDSAGGGGSGGSDAEADPPVKNRTAAKAPAMARGAKGILRLRLLLSIRLLRSRMPSPASYRLPTLRGCLKTLPFTLSLSKGRGAVHSSTSSPRTVSRQPLIPSSGRWANLKS